MVRDSNTSAMMVTNKMVMDATENVNNKKIGIVVEDHQFLEATVSNLCPLDL